MLVCFDLGGVIVRTCSSWREGCAAAGLDYRAEIDEPGRRAAFSRVVVAYETDAIAWPEYLELGARALDGLYSGAELGRIHEAWLRGEFDGVSEVVRSINAAAGHRTGCLSNTNRRHWELMGSSPERFPAFHALQDRLASFHFRLMKPEAEIYRAIETATGASAEEGILFFDDLRENIDGARACGWKAEWIDRAGDIAGQMRAALSRHGVRLR